MGEKEDLIKELNEIDKKLLDVHKELKELSIKVAGLIDKYSK